jgi:DNA-binding MarR family transcriptional regulator
VVKPTREESMRKIVSTYAGEKRNGDLGPDDLGFLSEGLAFAQRPLMEGKEKVTQRYNLGPRGAFILNLLSNGLMYPLDLANALCCGRSLITADLSRLTEAGLITTRPGAHDRRRVELTLTEAGLQATEEIRRETSRIILTNLAAYSADEIRKFAEMLRAVRSDPVITSPALNELVSVDG